eukprot:GEMP01006040.1.p1 GENE.GEMP01006040.1~~GEMP01006040.1.p1  ORF type:complete len:419 (-),score=87.52 GEMP01006040.1:1185-2441(-)
MVGSIDAKSAQYIENEEKYGAHNYHPIPVVVERAEGIYCYDVTGKRYIDFLAAYGACNQGHGHPRIIKALVEQSCKLALTSRAFHNDVYSQYAKYVTEFFGFDKILPMNTGAEACETAVKLARKWAYEVKKVPENQAVIIWAKDNFCGRTIMCVSVSNDPDAYGGYGPFVGGMEVVPYNDVKALEETMEKHSANLAGFYIEPIQGEAGVIVPNDDYLPKAKALCEKHKCLFIADEIQSGLCRTGKMLACDHFNVKPDVLVLGKAMSGGLYPVSGVLASNEVMLTIQPGQHGSTYGGNPIACKVAMEALQILKDEELADNAECLGEIFRTECSKMKFAWIKEIRGKGLMNAIELDSAFATKISAWDVCLKLKDNGLLAKPTHNSIIRFTPPLTMTKEQMTESIKIITKVFGECDKIANA